VNEKLFLKSGMDKFILVINSTTYFPLHCFCSEFVHLSVLRSI